MTDFESRNLLIKNMVAQASGALNRGIAPPSKLIIGQVGSGKSYLLKKIYSMIIQDQEIYENQGIKVIDFPNIFAGPLFFLTLKSIVDEYSNNTKYNQILLVIDDIDHGLEGDKSTQSVTRALLQESKLKISLIATATNIKFLTDYGAPLYRFFGVPLEIGKVDILEAKKYILNELAGSAQELTNSLQSVCEKWINILSTCLPGRLYLLKTCIQNEINRDSPMQIITKTVIENYLNYYEPYFRRIMHDLPHSQRAIIEIGALQIEKFTTTDMSFISRNISTDVKRLVNKGILKIVERGFYEFEDSLFKFWLRYLKNASIEECFKFDIKLMDPRVLDLYKDS